MIFKSWILNKYPESAETQASGIFLQKNIKALEILLRIVEINAYFTLQIKQYSSYSFVVFF